MEPYDIVMLAVLGVTTFWGYRKGLAWQIASLAAIGISYFVAYNFRDRVAAQIDMEPPWNTFLAMLGLYLGTSFAIWLMFRMVSGAIDQAKMKDFDRQLGAIFGAAKGALLCVIITMFAVSLLGENLRVRIVSSRSGLYIARFLDRSEAIMPPELHEVLDPYLRKVDERLQPALTPPGYADPGSQFDFPETDWTGQANRSQPVDPLRDAPSSNDRGWR